MRKTDKLLDWKDAKGNERTYAMKAVITALKNKHGPKIIRGFFPLFDAVLEISDMPHDFAKHNPETKKPYFHQAIRNIAKVGLVRGPDPWTDGELIILKGGGAALPSAILASTDRVVKPPKVSPTFRTPYVGEVKKKKQETFFDKLPDLVDDIHNNDSGETEYDLAYDELVLMAKVADRSVAELQQVLLDAERPLTRKK